MPAYELEVLAIRHERCSPALSGKPVSPLVPVKFSVDQCQPFFAYHEIVGSAPQRLVGRVPIDLDHLVCFADVGNQQSTVEAILKGFFRKGPWHLKIALTGSDQSPYIKVRLRSNVVIGNTRAIQNSFSPAHYLARVLPINAKGFLGSNRGSLPRLELTAIGARWDSYRTRLVYSASVVYS
jgi:hypothetical protein